MSNAIFENSRVMNYDQFVTNWIPNYHYFLNLLPALLKEHASEELLVAGCGTGNEMDILLKANPNWKMTGVDPSPEMIQQARIKLAAYNHITLTDGLVSYLPEKVHFGAVTLLLVLHFLEDDGAKLQLLQDIADRLKKDAPLVLLDITGTQQEIRDNLRVLRSVVPASVTDSEIDERLDRIENELHYVSEERIEDLLLEAGFSLPVRFFLSSIYRGFLAKRVGNDLDFTGGH